MKILFIVPEIRMDSGPAHFPFWAAILAAIVEKKGGKVGILDLNALRTKYGGAKVPTKIIEEEISSEDWDLIGIGGLTTVYNRIKELAPIVKKMAPSSIFLGGGGWSSYNPDEILKLIPELDLICIGEGEETFSEIYDAIENNSNDFENINGLCIRDKDSCIWTKPRALIDDLNTVPYPAYHLLETDVYFAFSSLPYSVESFNSKRRASVVWERGCPRGCTFCSHNGMSRIDLQNIYGEGDRKAGEKLVRISDKENDTFQLPARWPTPEYAVNNVKLLKEKFDVDFISIVDENMTSNLKWTTEFCDLYKKSGLSDQVKWGTLGDAPSVAVKPELIQIMKDAGCAYISFGFESASDKVLNEDIQKGQTRVHLQKTLDTILKAKLTPLTTFMIGNQHENINDLMETMDFWIQNNAEIDPFICTPYVGSPIYYNNKNRILSQYDPKIKLIEEGKLKVDKETESKWKLDALDMFMTDCGDAYQYTATISEYFSIPELFAIKNLMYQKDSIRLLAWAHERYEETHEPQWKHDAKWAKYCNVCKAESLMNELQIPHQI
jgi:anaerobic magnesium-protoporphyrin IX monomethyl ester cyclase|tara:strand:- start:4434 stop:6089 length:1656 start_codon:yes stop_codon:yes gene_type:complete